MCSCALGKKGKTKFSLPYLKLKARSLMQPSNCLSGMVTARGRTDEGAPPTKITSVFEVTVGTRNLKLGRAPFLSWTMPSKYRVNSEDL